VFVRLLQGRVLFAQSRADESDTTRRLAVSALKPIVDAGITSRDALERLAVLYAELNRHAEALEAYRTLLAGVRAGEADWFRLKVGQLSALVKTDERRAREVFEQLRVLYPDLGPEPWRTELRSLDQVIAGGPASP
jgi:tetratricopeptide (TPR) repeat protein